MVPLSRALISRVLLATTLLMPMALPSAAGAVVPADVYETGARDDTPATARDLKPLVDYVGWSGWYGQSMSQEVHTFDWVDDPNAESDEDWIKLQVAPEDVQDGFSYIIEAVSVDSNVDPVIEMYGPVSASGEVTWTAPGLLSGGLDPNRYDGNDDGPNFSLLSSSLSFIPEAPGWYYIRIRPCYYGPDAGFNGEGRYTLRMKAGQLTRISGANRIDTAIAISRERFSSIGPVSNAVVIANAYGFPDALAGSTLAGVLDCPLLLTPRDTLAAPVANEIKRLRIPTGWFDAVQPQTVYILGGSAAISSTMEAQIRSIGATPVRIAGASRTETARRITEKASQIASATGTPFSSVAFLASSSTFPDALAASPMAAYNHAPVLMTPRDVLDPHAEAVLKNPSLGITDVVIVGGPTAVSTAVEARVKSLLGSTHVLRKDGASRYQTARNFAVWATGVSTGADRVGTEASPTALAALDFQRIGVASGENFPDALAGGIFCGLAGSPILLTPRSSVSPYLHNDEWTTTTGYFKVPAGDDYWWAETPLGESLAITRSYVFGGATAVSGGVMLTLDVFTGPAF
ncbi:MAG: cell wall-binding repeat-containing protein [Coriobacteriia bacterium]